MTDNNKNQWDLIKNILQNSSPSTKYGNFTLKNNGEVKKTIVRLYYVFDDISKMIEDKNAPALSNFFSLYDLSEASHSNLNLSITNTLLDFFNPDVAKVLISNNFPLDKELIFNYIFDHPSIEILSFVEENEDKFSKINFVDNIYKTSIHTAMQPKQKRDNFFDFSQYIDFIDKKRGKDNLDKIWNNANFQADILLNYRPNGYSRIESCWPENIKWDKTLLKSVMEKSLNRNPITHEPLNFLHAREEIPGLKKSLDNLFARLKSDQDLFFKLLSSDNSSPHHTQNTYLLNFLNSESFKYLGLGDEGVFQFMGVFNYDDPMTHEKSTINFQPSNMVEMIALESSSSIYNFLDSDEGREMLKNALSKPPIMIGFLKSSTDKKIEKTLSLIDLSDWRDSQNNNILHYLLVFQENAHKYNALSKKYDGFIDKYSSLLSDKNNRGLSAFDIILKKPNISLDEISFFEKKLISGQIKTQPSNSLNKRKLI